MLANSSQESLVIQQALINLRYLTHQKMTDKKAMPSLAMSALMGEGWVSGDTLTGTRKSTARNMEAASG